MNLELPKHRNAISPASQYVANSLCVTAIIDETYEKYLPFFLYTHFRANPFYKVKIFHRKKLTSAVRDVCDKYIKHKWGLVEDVFPEYSQYGRATAALRFLVPAEHFKDVEYVFFTDIDFLWYLDAGTKDFGAVHYNLMKQPHGGKCYENFAVKCVRVTGKHSMGYRNGKTQTDGTQPVFGFRMPGVHFVSKEWFLATASARKEELQKLLPIPKPGYEYDEKMLYDIHKNAGLPITQKGHENWRWHAFHLGQFRNMRGSVCLTQGDYTFLKQLYKEQSFIEILTELRKFVLIEMVFQNLENTMEWSQRTRHYEEGSKYMWEKAQKAKASRTSVIGGPAII